MHTIIAMLIGITAIYNHLCRHLSHPPPEKAHADYRVQDTTKLPQVTITDTSIGPMTLLMIRDTAQTVEDIGTILNTNYGELFTYLNQYNIQPKKIMAFYHTYQPPYVMDAAVEVDKEPQQVTGNIRMNKMNGGQAVVAHYQGPYERVDTAYTIIGKWLQDKRKTPEGSPFEVYLNDPSAVSDPYQLRTDIYQMVKQ